MMLDEIKKKIDAAPILLKPFPHIIIDDFLPENLVDRILEEFPGDKFFEGGSTTSMGRKILTDNKKHGNNNGWAELLLRSPAIRMMHQNMTGEIYKQILLDKFKEVIPFVGGSLENVENYESQCDWSRAGEGYVRSIHLDREYHVISSMLYFNSTEDYRGIGGDLLMHRHKDGELLEKFPRDEDMILSKRVPTEKNRYIIWLGCPGHYHSVDPIMRADGYRKFVYIAINDPDELTWPRQKVSFPDMKKRFLNQ